MSNPGFFDDLKASLGVTAVEDDEEGWKDPAVEVFMLRADRRRARRRFSARCRGAEPRRRTVRRLLGSRRLLTHGTGGSKHLIHHQSTTTGVSVSNIDDDKTDPQATLYDEKAEEPSFLDDLRDTFAKFGVQAPQATRAAEADETPQPARNETPGTPLQLLIMMAAFCLIAVIAVGFFGKALEAKREGQKKVESSQVESSQVEQP